jgi:hypothetical protein
MTKSQTQATISMTRVLEWEQDTLHKWSGKGQQNLDVVFQGSTLYVDTATLWEIWREILKQMCFPKDLKHSVMAKLK